MKPIHEHLPLLVCLGVIASACGDDLPSTGDTEGSSTGEPTMMTTPGVTMTTTSTTTSTVDDTSTSGADDTTTEEPPPMTDDGSTDEGGIVPQPAEFFVRIENISDESVLPTAISPGVWVNHESGVFPGFFTAMAPEPGNGVEQLAEDGDPAALAASIATRTGVYDSGIFDTPVGAATPGPIMPGESYEFTFTSVACEGTSAPFVCPRLSLAMMLVESNDLLLATGPAGLGLYVQNSQPQGTHTVSASFNAWDVGTEANQAPRQGPNQAPYSGPNVGPPESGVVDRFASSTRAIPLAPALVDVVVAQTDGVFTITVNNLSGAFGTLVTPLSDLVWATHDDTASLFDAGAAASPGLEVLAEDGDGSVLQGELAGAAGFDLVGVEAGPFLPGESIAITLTPNASNPYLSFATMLVQTNDAFLAMAPAGVALLDANGTPRANGEIRADILRTLGAWDAGTEANEVPGAGPNQPLRQAAPDTGLADATPTVHRYFDITNDLEGPLLGGFLQITVEDSGGAGLAMDVTITNTSATTAFAGALSPAVWAVHDGTLAMFNVGGPASAGIEALAEDGNAATLLASVQGNAAVSEAAIAGAGPLMPGDSITFTVTPTMASRFLSLAAMVAPSNDTFMAFEGGGVALLDAAGVQRSSAEIADDIAAMLFAWDAGTENNQAGAIGASMSPPGAPNTGLSEGSGVVRDADDDPVWPVPDPRELMIVTIGPTGN